MAWVQAENDRICKSLFATEEKTFILVPLGQQNDEQFEKPKVLQFEKTEELFVFHKSLISVMHLCTIVYHYGWLSSECSGKWEKAQEGVIDFRYR